MAYTQQETYWGTPNAVSDIYGNNWSAMTWITQSAYTITQVDIRIYRVGSPGIVTVSIKATDVNGKPTSDDLVFNTFNGDDVTTGTGGETWSIPFSGYALNNSTNYAIVVRASNGTSTNKIVWKVRTGNPYATGALTTSTDGGSTWAAPGTVDAAFTTYSTVASNYDEGTVVVTGTGIVSLSVEIGGLAYSEGIIVVSAIISTLLTVEVSFINKWLKDRPEDYDSTLVYDEEITDWITNDGRGGGRFQNRILIIDELGNVYVG